MRSTTGGRRVAERYVRTMRLAVTCHAHGAEALAAHAADRSGQEGGVRAAVCAAGQDAVAGGAPADPRIPRRTRCQLRAQRHPHRADAAAARGAEEGRVSRAWRPASEGLTGPATACAQRD